MLQLEADPKDLDKQIRELLAKLSDPDQELLSIEHFLNLVVNKEKVASYQMTKAFSKLEKAQSVLNGRGERIAPALPPLRRCGVLGASTCARPRSAEPSTYHLLHSQNLGRRLIVLSPPLEAKEKRPCKMVVFLWSG